MSDRQQELILLTRTNARGDSCNFCSRGEYNGHSMVRPYDSVTQMERRGNNGLSARICDDCLQVVADYAKGVR